MFGDCQVLSSMGGGGRGNGDGVPSDSFFPSSLQNPNSFNFMSNLPFTNIFPPLIPKEENGISSKSKEEMMESGSGSELQGDEHELVLEADDHQQQEEGPNKKKRYHRHTTHQIQEMEALFKECPHPDDKQRMKLSQDLGLKPRQVKFWFQNRRTQMKAQHDRQDNVILRAENENLKTENYRLQTALRNVMCPNCGGPAMLAEIGYDEQQVRLENAKLKDELERVCLLISQYTGRPIHAIISNSLLEPSSMDMDMHVFPRKFDHDPMGSCSDMINHTVSFMPETSTFGGGGVVILEEEKPLAMELAISSVEVLMKMCQMGEPLWIRPDENDKEVLHVEEYLRMFPWPGELKQNPSEIRTEASRHSAVVIMNSITLVDAFLDAGKWMELFPSIVSRAKTLQVVNSGVSGHASGSLQLMFAETQMLSPLVPSRESHFLRYCHQNVEQETWVIVDFPLDSFHNSYAPTFPYYKKKPSGCIIQDMPNGYSSVTWIEHVEVELNHAHQIFNKFVSSSLAFGAQRWLATLQRQCERIASLMARNISDLGVIPSPEARKNLMNLSQRMIRTFSLNIGTSCGQTWTALSDSPEDTIRITPRKVVDPGEPNGLVLSAVSTTWLPYSHFQVFEFLRDECRRAQLDVISNGNSLQEVAHIANGSNPGNCISLLRINVASNSSQRVELMLQESCFDDSGSLVVYAIVDVEAIQLAMNGEDPSCIPLLPLGFVIHPMPAPPHHQDSSITGGEVKNTQSTENALVQEPGCLLTVGLQVLASTIPTAKLNLSSVTAINHNLCNTIQQITAALGNGNNVISTADNGSTIIASSTKPPAPATSAPMQQADQDSS